MAKPIKPLDDKALAQATGGNSTNRPTIYNDFDGTEGNDSMIGGGNGDAFWGYEGNDTVRGMGGNDNIFGGDGADELHGMGGSDYIDGGTGDGVGDLMTGGHDDDRFFWQPGNGNDTIDGGEDNDMLWISKVPLAQVLAGLEVTTPGAVMRISGSMISFVDQWGEAQPVEGTLRIGSETVTFRGLESFNAPG